MSFYEDMTIDKKYLNIVDIPIYDTNRKWHGIISEISLLSLSNGFYIQYYAHYDSVHNREIIFSSDFNEGNIKFVLFKDKEYEKGALKESQGEKIKAIKEFLGENYSENSIIWISGRERRDQIEAQKYREIKKMGNELPWSENATREFIFESYSALKLFCLYADGVIKEKRFLRELVNVLANEKRAQKEMSLNTETKSLVEDFRKVFNKNKNVLEEV